MASEHHIDEGLYSRQLYVLGHEAMKKMSASNVLIVGLGGLGCEIAKNVILAGVKSVTLYDPAPAQIAHLSSQFYLGVEDLGKPRAASCVSKLAELNPHVPVHVLDGQLSNEQLKQFTVVVLTDATLSQQLNIADFTHMNDIKFIAAETRGVFASVFCDFGKEFVVSDVTGEQPLSGLVASVQKDAQGIVTCLDESRHGLEDGDHVTFTEVQGMTELNACEPRKVTVLGPYTFSIGDTSKLSAYKAGGIFTQVRMPKVLSFKSLRESIKAPEILMSDFAKFDRPAQLHLAFQALGQFVDKNFRLPKPYNEADAAEILSLVQALNTEKLELDEKLIKLFSHVSAGDISPMIAFTGGLVAQEVLKACSGKFHPIVQHFYFDSTESLPTEPVTEADAKPLGTRYDGQIAVFGKKFQDKIANLNMFMVGSGAIGCELLKNWALMGVSSQNGSIVVTDMDSIEKSNLNRQFLFRSKDVGSPKSTSAAAAISVMNPDLKGKVIAKQDRVGVETESIFDDIFWKKLSFVTNALDNVEARRYVDRRCVYFKKALLESGTLGTKGNTQVIVPSMTESYSSSQDPPEKSIPMCTLRSFPNIIEHTIERAKEFFETAFNSSIIDINMYINDPEFISNTIKLGGSPKDILENVLFGLTKFKPNSFDDCIIWARMQFEEFFNTSIQQLLYNLPKDHVTSSGVPFWSGPKRAPDPITFDASNALHIDFIVSAANLRAYNYGIAPQGREHLASFKKVLDNIIVPEFVPKKGIKIQVSENDPVGNTSTDQQELDAVIKALPTPPSLSGTRLLPAEFEKDDDSNYHIDVITAFSNLRATNYNIPTADRHKTKGIAGKIIPAIATTTSLITGLVCLEMYKIIDGAKLVTDYKNGFVNLALPFFGFSEPIAATQYTYHDTQVWSLWDRFEVEGDLTLGQVIEHFKQKHELEVTMLSCGASVLYASFMPKKKLEDRMNVKISELVVTITKKPIPDHVKSLVLEVCVNDRTGEDVEVPYIKLNIRE